MSQFQRRTAFLKKALAVTVAGLMVTSVHAASDKDEIKQLREEVQALKALIQQQQQVQQNQQVQIEQSRRAAVVVATPTQVTAVAAPVASSASPLASLKSKMGANVKLYGSVRADAEYQFKGGDGMFNRINAVELNGDSEFNKDRFYSTVTTSRVGLDFVAPVQGADVGGKIELDFRGGSNSDTVRIRHAYMTYNNWLVGQTTSSFLSGDTQPEMLDFNAALGIGTFRTPMVRYSDKINATTSYAVGLEQGDNANRLPTATAKVSHKFNGDQGLITARALIQEARLRTPNEVKDANGNVITPANKNNDQTEFSWGVAAGAKYKFTDQISVTADYTHLKGDKTYLLYDKDMAFNTSKSDLELIDQDAVSVGATYRFNPQWRTNLGYGAIFYDKQAKGQNDKLQQGWLNVMYNPIQPVTLGAEYVYGERSLTTSNDIDRVGRDSRIGVMAKYDF